MTAKTVAEFTLSFPSGEIAANIRKYYGRFWILGSGELRLDYSTGLRFFIETEAGREPVSDAEDAKLEEKIREAFLNACKDALGPRDVPAPGKAPKAKRG